MHYQLQGEQTTLPKLGKSPSRLGEIRTDVSAASFTALLDRAQKDGPNAHNFYDSGEVTGACSLSTIGVCFGVPANSLPVAITHTVCFLNAQGTADCN